MLERFEACPWIQGCSQCSPHLSHFVTLFMFSPHCPGIIHGGALTCSLIWANVLSFCDHFQFEGGFPACTATRPICPHCTVWPPWPQSRQSLPSFDNRQPKVLLNVKIFKIARASATYFIFGLNTHNVFSTMINSPLFWWVNLVEFWNLFVS